jgi:hypothetical protein
MKLLLSISKCLAKYSLFRKIGVYLLNNKADSIKYAIIKLFIESYLDLALITFNNSVVFIEAKSKIELV